MSASRLLCVLSVLLAFWCAGCGGGGGGTSDLPPPTYVHLQSDAGDYIGAGKTYSYTQADALVFVSATGGLLSVRIEGDEDWRGDFQVPSGLDRLEPGRYEGLQRYPFHDSAKGGLAWSGEGRGSNTLTGWFAIDSVTYSDGALTEIDLRFEQHSGGQAPALHGQIHWRIDDATAPPGPTDPPAPGLWRPVAGSVPSAGNYVFLQSDSGDYVGAGQTYTYTHANAQMTVTAAGGRLSVRVDGDETWAGDFQAMSGRNTLERGYYGGLQRFPGHNPARGGLNWGGEGRGGNTLTGWFAVDEVTYADGTLVAIDLRFEQHCEGQVPALHGRIRWAAADVTVPTGPLTPAPEGLWEPPPGATPAAGSYVYLQSDPGDPIGQGQTCLYTQADAILVASTAAGHFAVRVEGDQKWWGDFQAMSGFARLDPGYYGDLQRFPFHNPVRGGLSWWGDGRASNALTGWFVVDDIRYVDGMLQSIDLRFEQHSEGGTPALHGQIRWRADDATAPPGPVSPPPGDLWEPPLGSTPATGRYVYLESDPGDWVGAGHTYGYTPADAQVTVDATGGFFSVQIAGDENWTGNFQAMSGLSQLEPGYYGDLRGYPFHNPAEGGLTWFGEGRGCGSWSDWFVVDDVTYADGALASIDLRFEQHCDGEAPALRGKIHWSASDAAAPPGPLVPPPVGLWQPAPGATPAAGSFVYLESDQGDFIGAGEIHTYTLADAQMSATATGGRLSVGVVGDEDWSGTFQAMSTLSRLEPGYYGDLQRFPFHNPAKGGLSWTGEGHGCNILTGWFVVDEVAYADGALASVDLRFEQHCEGMDPALRGRVRWTTDDATVPPGPVVPPPIGLWQPGAGFTPPAGNYVHLQSDPGDFIGAGQTRTYTQANAQVTVSTTDGRLSVGIAGDQDWRGNFQVMSSLAELQPGYYGDLQEYPFHNPAKGGLDWSGEGRGCNVLSGWFVVDDVRYENGALASIDLRFEQYCEGEAPALHGEVHWAAGDPSAPPGPVTPPPAELWRPAPGSTPAAGAFVYLQSDAGDYIGAGRTYTYTGADAQVSVGASGGRLSVQVEGTESWWGTFQTMSGLGELQPGYYGDLQRYPFHNPVKGGLSWSGEGRGCNTLTGWFVVDDVTYAEGALASIDLRFEQHCGVSVPALHGQVRWAR